MRPGPDRPAAVRALTKIFLAEIERLLCAAAGGTIDADALPVTRPRLGAVSFLHPFALERLSVIRGPAGRITQVRYVLPRHKAANWVGRGRGRKSTRPGGNGVVELTPFEFLDRLADLVPPPRKHRHQP